MSDRKIKTQESTEVLLKRVARDGMLLEHIEPERRRQEREVCLAAVRQNGLALQFVPYLMRDAQMCAAAELAKSRGQMLRFMPVEHILPSYCVVAVSADGYALHHVPRAMVTPELCLMAVKVSGRALAYVPPDMRTAELCLAAVESDGAAMQYVDESKRDLHLCSVAVSRDGFDLEYVPRALLKDVVAKVLSMDSASQHPYMMGTALELGWIGVADMIYRHNPAVLNDLDYLANKQAFDPMIAAIVRKHELETVAAGSAAPAAPQPRL